MDMFSEVSICATRCSWAHKVHVLCLASPCHWCPTGAAVLNLVKTALNVCAHACPVHTAWHCMHLQVLPCLLCRQMSRINICPKTPNKSLGVIVRPTLHYITRVPFQGHSQWQCQPQPTKITSSMNLWGWDMTGPEHTYMQAQWLSSEIKLRYEAALGMTIYPM